MSEKAQSTEKKSLNDRLAGGALKFGLNDRIGFVKDLFDGSAEDFNRVVSQLNTLGSLGEAQDFLTTHIAPEYGWADNEETAGLYGGGRTTLRGNYVCNAVRLPTLWEIWRT